MMEPIDEFGDPAIGRLSERVDRLQRQLNRSRGVSVVLIGVFVVTAVTAWQQPVRRSETIRTRLIVVEDAQGRDRIIIGAPRPDPIARALHARGMVGMQINDTLGHERFGLGLTPSGRMSMGFDAPPGTGDDRNRERINMWADQHGGAAIRFLDRNTMLKSIWQLDQENRVWLEFYDFPEGEIVRRKIGFGPDQLVRHPRPSR
jgi:hypothetical protein